MLMLTKQSEDVMKKLIFIALLGASIFTSSNVIADTILPDGTSMEIRQELAERSLQLIAEKRGVHPSEVKFFTDSNIKITIEKYGSGNEVYHYRYVEDQFEEDRRLRGTVRW